MLKGSLRLLGLYKLYEMWLWRQIKSKPLPSHIAIILDGNRRWAKRRGLPSWAGHEKAVKRVEEVLKWCLEAEVKTITLYALSIENLRRPPRERRALFRIIREALERALKSDQIHKNKVRIRALGRLALLPEDLKEIINKLEEVTKDYKEHYLNVAIAYGGRAEIVDAVRRISEKVRKGMLNPSSINEGMIEDHLYTSYLPNPHPDVIIRTSGEERLSGLLLWQAAYSEFVFLDVYFPEIRKIDFWRAIRTYQKRQRRYGL